jgi:uncharacterized protein YceK
MKKFLKVLSLVLAIALSLSGCAATQTQKAESTEQMLTAAGFQMKYADTPQRQAHIHTIPPRTIVAYPYKGKVMYAYRETSALYLGNQAAYQRFQQMAFDKKIATQMLEAAEINEATGWPWGFYY